MAVQSPSSQQTLRRWLVLREAPGSASPAGAPGDSPLLEPRLTESPSSRIFCAACGYFITSPDQRIAVDGSHEHEFMNPAGLRFRIRCFASAPGTAGAGEVSQVWTWFPGYAWQAVLCRGCLRHLGWSYVRTESSFFGLIAERICEASPAKPD
ncbi:MAG TPA: cereblon family protein [Polyangiaceae bacterium]|nr:cereblon family protein [Polyangiaceae bacterium]